MLRETDGGQQGLGMYRNSDVLDADCGLDRRGLGRDLEQDKRDDSYRTSVQASWWRDESKLQEEQDGLVHYRRGVRSISFVQMGSGMSTSLEKEMEL